jgi:hypothetical protein
MMTSHNWGVNVTFTPALPTEPIKLKNQVRKVSIMAVNRWTDEMLDRLADSVSELRTSLEALVQAFIQEHEENRQHRQEMRAWQQEMRTWQRQMEEWQRENDLRFNILLEEIRASNQRIKRLEDAQNNSHSE